MDNFASYFKEVWLQLAITCWPMPEVILKVATKCCLVLLVPCRCTWSRCQNLPQIFWFVVLVVDMRDDKGRVGCNVMEHRVRIHFFWELQVTNLAAYSQPIMDLNPLYILDRSSYSFLNYLAWCVHHIHQMMFQVYSLFEEDDHGIMQSLLHGVTTSKVFHKFRIRFLVVKFPCNPWRISYCFCLCASRASPTAIVLEALWVRALASWQRGHGAGGITRRGRVKLASSERKRQCTCGWQGERWQCDRGTNGTLTWTTPKFCLCKPLTSDLIGVCHWERHPKKKFKCGISVEMSKFTVAMEFVQWIQNMFLWHMTMWMFSLAWTGNPSALTCVVWHLICHFTEDKSRIM